LKDTGGPIATLAESRAYLDCTSFKEESAGRVGDVWRLIVIYPSKLKISDVFKSKRGMFEPTVQKLSQMLH
jgi:hypothetical protein